ncbi:ketosynthase, partial [Xanthomonas oryzae pv. oryzae]
MLGMGVLLAVAYSPLAHWANASHRPEVAAIAGGLLVLMVLIEPMVARRAWAWALALLLLAGLGVLWHSPYAMVVLAAPPVVFT